MQLVADLSTHLLPKQSNKHFIRLENIHAVLQANEKTAEINCVVRILKFGQQFYTCLGD